jgi:hypothetical protein
MQQLVQQPAVVVAVKSLLIKLCAVGWFHSSEAPPLHLPSPSFLLSIPPPPPSIFGICPFFGGPSLPSCVYAAAFEFVFFWET